MSLLFHITTEAAWRAALTAGVYRATSLDTEGFIHLSTGAQWQATQRRFFHRQSGLVLLVIDATKLTAVRFEHADGEDFPHLYAVLPCATVVAVRSLRPGG